MAATGYVLVPNVKQRLPNVIPVDEDLKNVIDVTCLHHANAVTPIDVTELGIVMEVREIQLVKAD